jgi:hypothetical protein
LDSAGSNLVWRRKTYLAKQKQKTRKKPNYTNEMCDSVVVLHFSTHQICAQKYIGELGKED